MIVKKIMWKIKKYYVMLRGYFVHGHEVGQSHDKCIVLWGIPEHGNRGDQAITFAEVAFLKKVFPKTAIKCIPERECNEYLLAMKHLSRKKKVLFIGHGGGNIGELYGFQESLRLSLIKHMKSSPIIIFPQSVDYGKNSKKLKKAKKIYEKHKYLYLFARENTSYKKMRLFFRNCNVQLVPDIVASLDLKKENILRRGVLFCVRNDKEKNENSKQKTVYLNNKIKGITDDIEMIDTCGEEYIEKYENQADNLYKLWKKFCSKELIVTDRLHGMIFALITGTPCIALDNSTGKVFAFYDTWLKERSNIMCFRENKDSVDCFMDEILIEKKYPDIMMGEFKFHFDILRSTLKNLYDNKDG